MLRLLMFWLVGAFFLPGVAASQLRINEILADPNRDWNGDAVVNFKDDEWVEVFNAGPGTVQLDSFRLSDAAGDFRYGWSGTLEAGRFCVVYGSDSVAWEQYVGASTVGLSLNNTGDTVKLWQLAGADTFLVDEYSYASYEVLDDRSTGRMPDGADAWFLFDAFLPYTGADPPLPTGCPPTPGAPNTCPTPIGQVSWSAIKVLFDTDR